MKKMNGGLDLGASFLQANRPLRPVTLLIIHCTATPAGREVSRAEVDRWHRQRGWNGIGYHYLIHLDGSIEQGRPEERVGAHCKGYNACSIGICYVGGLDEAGRPADTRTNAQCHALRQLLLTLRQRYPHAAIRGHRDLNPQKACPCFDATTTYAGLVLTPTP